MNSFSSLFKNLSFVFSRRFLLFFVCQFLGAANDNIFRLAFIGLLSFGALADGGKLIPLVLALFMLPFFLFSAVAGKITDTVGKRKMLRLTKFSELLIMTLAAAGIASNSGVVLFAAIFLTGAQSAFFGPLKYSILPAIVGEKSLVDANALVGVSTFVAILSGVIIGGVGATQPTLVIIIMPLLSLAGFVAAMFFPPLDNEPSQKITAADFRLWTTSKKVVQEAISAPIIFWHILAISMFWAIGGQLLGELPQMGDEKTYHLLLALSVGGVGLGMVLCLVIFRGDITTKYAPLSLLAAGFLLFAAAANLPVVGESPSLFFIFCLISCCAAIIVYVVPLSASLQKISAPETRAQTMGALNIFNALFIVVAALLAIAAKFLSEHATQNILFAIAAAAVVASFLCLSLIPLEESRKIVAAIFRVLFRVEVKNFHRLQNARGVIISNHVSLLDAPLLSVFLSRPGGALSFAIDVEQAKRFYVRPLLKLVNAYPINTLNPYSIRRLIASIRANPEARFTIFPEGRISVTGGMMKNYPGAGIITMKAGGGVVIPVHIEGAQYSKFSYLRGKVKQRWFPKIILHIGEATKLQPPEHLKGRRQRMWLADKTATVLRQNAYRLPTAGDNLTRVFISSARKNGFGQEIFSELPSRVLTYRTLFRTAFALGKKMPHAPGDKIGVLLPSSLGAATLFYAANFYGFTPVMLNPGSGERQVLSACKTAAIRKVYTAKLLAEKSATAAAIIDSLRAAGMEVFLLDEMREKITVVDKIQATVAAMSPTRFIKKLPGYNSPSDKAAAVLFTSGSESEPKGVVLSHKNFIANGRQILLKLNVNGGDVLLNTLPVFHSFGLMAGVVLPVMVGAKTLQYPTPLHYRIVPELIYLSNATVFFSADTFLMNYGNAAHPSDFVSLRLVIAGAEKLKEPTRQLWREKFGIRIMEGYGVTEASPAIAFNTAAENKSGSVGRILQGMETRLEKIPDIERGGRLFVRGANVMSGYYLSDQPAKLQPPKDGWHDTGDIADIDADGYLTILGRAKRFAKVAGEMVPLDGVEAALKNVWQNEQFAVITRHDGRRGESLVLLTNKKDAAREDIIAALKKQKLPDLWAPRQVLLVDEIPLLPTGKINYPAAATIAEKKLTATNDKKAAG